MCIGGAQGSKKNGSPCVKLIILVLFILSAIKDLEKDKKIMKNRNPYGVTHKSILVIFNDFHYNMKVDIWKNRFFKNRSGV